MRVLLLGGTAEARQLAAALHPGVEVISSLAGRVPDPALPVGAVRIGGFGGVGGLVEKFQQGGLGDIVSSWVGTGANLPVSAEQIQSVLDDSQLCELAGRLGIDPQQAAEMASQYLPSIVDRLTPNGEIPAGGDLLGHGVELLKGLFNR